MKKINKELDEALTYLDEARGERDNARDELARVSAELKAAESDIEAAPVKTDRGLASLILAIIGGTLVLVGFTYGFFAGPVGDSYPFWGCPWLFIPIFGLFAASAWVNENRNFFFTWLLTVAFAAGVVWFGGAKYLDAIERRVEKHTAYDETTWNGGSISVSSIQVGEGYTLVYGNGSQHTVSCVGDISRPPDPAPTKKSK